MKGIAMTNAQKADIQLTSNVVIVSPDHRVLLTQYDESDDRYWIPGASLETYEHPDAAALRGVVDVLPHIAAQPKLSHIESFRGRRGWHVMFNYVVRTDREPASDSAKWFDVYALPATAHGDWEKGVITKAHAAS
jgi:ADP-ribose pyrophosphatase YjhB (NUDIX family)